MSVKDLPSGRQVLEDADLGSVRGCGGEGKLRVTVLEVLIALHQRLFYQYK